MPAVASGTHTLHYMHSSNETLYIFRRQIFHVRVRVCVCFSEPGEGSDIVRQGEYTCVIERSKGGMSL